MEPIEWWEVRDNVLELATWLNEEMSELQTPEDMLYFFEKPWKWEENWNQYNLTKITSE